jgi:hypothetical protein
MSSSGDITLPSVMKCNKTPSSDRLSTAFDWQNATRPLRFRHPNPAAPRVLRTADALRQMSVTLRVLAAIVVGCIFSATAHAARVAILSDAWSAETAANFSANITGDVFTGIDVSSSVPPLATLLANYDVVLLFEDATFVNATAVGNRVAEFSNAGRAVVLGTFYDQDRSDATGGTTTPHGWGTLETIDPDTTDGVGTSYAVRTLAPATIVPHPLTRGVTSLAALRGNPGPYAGGNQAKPGTVVVAAWAQPNARGLTDPAIAYRKNGLSCLIQIGIAPQYGVLATFGTFGTDFAGDFYRVWANAFAYGATSCRPSPIPTLTQWHLVLLAGLMLACGLAVLRERSRFRVTRPTITAGRRFTSG